MSEVQSWSDYYEPHPRLTLDRPVVLGGQLGCGAAAIARGVAGRTGLPFSEVDRLIEHEAGCSLARLAEQGGRERVDAWSRTVLTRLVDQRPFGLIALGSAWPGLEIERLLRRRAHFLAVERSRDHLNARIAKRVARAGGWLVEGFDAWSEADASWQPLFELRRPLLERAHGLLDAGDLHENAVVEVLLESLEPVFTGERI